MARLVAVHRMQIEFALHDPAAAAQIGKHTARQTGTQEGAFVAAVEPVFETERRRLRFVQRGGGVESTLPRHRRRRCFVDPGTACVLFLVQRCHRADGVAKKVCGILAGTIAAVAISGIYLRFIATKKKRKRKFVVFMPWQRIPG